MTANVIKLVNSAFFGIRQPVSTADRAVAYLGLDTLGALVLGHGVFRGGVTTGVEGCSLGRLWQHSLDVAAAARMVAVSQKLPPMVDEAHLGGMLHDVGKVVFATRLAAGADGPPVSAEDAFAQMEAHHAEGGAYLLGLWGFPNLIVEARAFYESPSQAMAPRVSPPALLHIAH